MARASQAKAGADFSTEVMPWGTIYRGTREALLAAGVLQEAWIPPRSERKNRSARTRLADGRLVRVYTKGKRTEVWLDATPEEIAAREVAEEARREAETAPFRKIHAATLAGLSESVRALARRYPRLRVTGADVLLMSGRVLQTIALRGKLPDLMGYGLVTLAMIECARCSDQRRGPRLAHVTPLGCGYSLRELDGGADYDKSSRFELRLSTATHPYGPERFAVTEARRVLARIFGGATAGHGKPARGRPSP